MILQALKKKAKTKRERQLAQRIFEIQSWDNFPYAITMKS
jgi:hypothetical protein